MSFAKKHFERVTAQLIAQAKENESTLNIATDYERMLHQLHQDITELKKIRAGKARNIEKAKLLPKYAAWVEGVMSNHSKRQDDIFVQIFIWTIDCEKWEEALAMFIKIQDAKMTLPDDFGRDAPTFIADEFSNSIISKNEESHPIKLETLEQLIELLADVDMHDAPKAKLYKALGLTLSEDPEANLITLEKSLAAFETAIRIDSRCAVKTNIKTLEKRMKQLNQ